MIANPSWTPPPSLRAERPELPGVIPPGPDNPLGNYWIGLSQEHIGLHGTNRPFGIGRQVSSGCIRLYPEHIQLLFERVHIGMAVVIIDQPIKLGHKNGQLYLEAHPDPDNRIVAPIAEILRQRDLIAPQAEIDWQQVRLILEQRTGVAQLIAAPLDQP
jgi:L,D-transpeptidase ErfK/SrfK